VKLDRHGEIIKEILPINQAGAGQFVGQIQIETMPDVVMTVFHKCFNSIAKIREVIAWPMITASSINEDGFQDESQI
jgi:hypothetical protein